MTDLLESGEEYRQRQVEAMLNNANDDHVMEEENNDSRERDEPPDQNRNVRQRSELTPLDINVITNRKMSKTKEITIPSLLQPKIKVNLKNHLNCMMIRMIANKHGSSDSLVRTYNRQQVGAKVTKMQNYTRLISVIIFEKNQPTSRIAYLMEDSQNLTNLWDFHVNIRDHGGITIGTAIRLYHVKPIEKIMADDCPSIVTNKPAVVLNDPIKLNEVPINFQVTAGIPTAFILNGCTIEIRDSEPFETGCGGLFCDKQRVREVMEYGQGCCCFKFSQRRANMEIIHTIVFDHHSLQEPIYIDEYSSTRFSLLFQNSVLNAEVTKESMDMTSKFSDMEEKIEKGVDLINKNGGFTIIGWYKRGQVQDRTVLIQKSSENTSKFSNTNNEPSKVDNSEIKIHPCVICPSNDEFYNKKSNLTKNLNEIKFDVKELMSGVE